METYRFDSQNQQQKRRGRAAADFRATCRVLVRIGPLDLLAGLKNALHLPRSLFRMVAADAAIKSHWRSASNGF